MPNLGTNPSYALLLLQAAKLIILFNLLDDLTRGDANTIQVLQDNCRICSMKSKVIRALHAIQPKKPCDDEGHRFSFHLPDGFRYRAIFLVMQQFVCALMDQRCRACCRAYFDQASFADPLYLTE